MKSLFLAMSVMACGVFMSCASANVTSVEETTSVERVIINDNGKTKGIEVGTRTKKEIIDETSESEGFKKGFKRTFGIELFYPGENLFPDAAEDGFPDAEERSTVYQYEYIVETKDETVNVQQNAYTDSKSKKIRSRSQKGYEKSKKPAKKAANIFRWILLALWAF